MYGKLILQALQTYTTIPFTHFLWSRAPKSDTADWYGILTENRIEKKVFDINKSEQVLDSDIDVFCYTDKMDEAKQLVESVFDTYQLAYTMDDIMYEQDTGLIHLGWKVRCIYCNGVSPLSTLYLHDLQPHLTSGYDLVQVQDANIVAENIKAGVLILGVTGTHSGGYPVYEGEYEITSSVQYDLTVETAERSMIQDFIVKKNITSDSPTPQTTGRTIIIY